MEERNTPSFFFTTTRGQVEVFSYRALTALPSTVTGHSEEGSELAVTYLGTAFCFYSLLVIVAQTNSGFNDH